MTGIGRSLKGLAALVALVALVVGVPVVLVVAAGWPLPGHVPSVTAIGDALTRDGVPADVIVKAVAVVLWVAWFQLTLSVGIEVAALLRRRQLAGVRGLGASRVVAASLVTAAATLLGSLGTIRPVGAVAAPKAVVAVPVGQAATSDASAERSAPTWTVRQRDTFWSIAEATLGSGERWREVERLNRGREVAPGVVLLPGTDLLRAGWTLRLPADAAAPATVETAAPAPEAVAATDRPAAPAAVGAPVLQPVTAPPASPSAPAAIAAPAQLVRVLPGDTLSSIARRAYGDATEWPRIWRANRGRVFGSHQLTDPNVIHAGWVLTVPPLEAGSPADRTVPVVRSRTSSTPHVHRKRAPTRPGSATPTPELAASPALAPTPAPATASPVDRAVEVSPTHVAPGSTELAPLADPSTPPLEPTAALVTSGGRASVDPWAISTGVLGAGLLATGVVGLVGSRRRRRLERAPVRALMPLPDPDLAPVERAARLGSNAAAAARVDAALRALAASRSSAATAARPVALRRFASGDLTLTLAEPTPTPAPEPWQPGDTPMVWALPATVPLADLVRGAGGVPSPCPALVLLGVDDDSELYVDLEALGAVVLDGPAEATRAIARAVVASLAVSPVADRVQVVAAGADCYGFANERLVHAVADAGAALELAGPLVAPVQRALDAEGLSSTLALRAHQPDELWEPTVVVALASASTPADVEALATLAGQGGRGLALVTDVPLPGATWRLRLAGRRWELIPLAAAVTPQGLAADELADLGALLADASSPLVDPPAEPPMAIRSRPMAPFVEAPWAVQVRVLGPVEVVDRAGRAITFERSKALELVVWLAQHRSHPTRNGARTALWESDVRDATFANIVSDARRALARAVPPPAGEEWIGRTYGEELPLHPLVVTDVDLLEARLAHARLDPDAAAAIALLRDGLALVRDLPYAGTSYLWTDAGGWPSHLTLLVIDAAVEMATRCLGGGDAPGAFWATAQGMRVLPAHDELVCLRLRAHAAQGNLAGVRQEFTSYERGLTADPWGDGEPSPKVVATRNELLRAAAMGPAA